MKYKFKFEKILDIKIKLEESKKMEISSINKEITDMRISIDTINSSINKNYVEFDDVMKQGTNIKDVIRFNTDMNFMREKMDRFKKDLVSKEKKLKLKQLEYVEILKEKKSFEILKEKDLINFQIELNKKEEEFVDQLVSFKYRSAN